MTLKEFIQEHENDDTARLILSRNKWPDIDIDKAVTIIECRKKIRTKLPEWYEIPEIIYPDRLSSEQSSSSATAKYKASVASRIANGGRIADLTGGLGADSLAFSRVASQVMYNEMEPATISRFSALKTSLFQASASKRPANRKTRQISGRH